MGIYSCSCFAMPCVQVLYILHTVTASPDGVRCTNMRGESWLFVLSVRETWNESWENDVLISVFRSCSRSSTTEHLVFECALQNVYIELMLCLLAPFCTRLWCFSIWTCLGYLSLHVCWRQLFTQFCSSSCLFPGNAEHFLRRENRIWTSAVNVSELWRVNI